MKTLIQLMIVALVFGGLSAAGTMFWQQRTDVKIAAGSDAASSHGNGEDAASDKSPADGASGQSDGSSEHPVETNQPTTDPAAIDQHSLGTADAAGSQHGPASSNPQFSIDPHPGVNSPDRNLHRGEAPVAVRPPYTPEGDEGGELINLLRDRAKAASEKERRIVERQDAIKLIFDDLRSEQAQTFKVRQQLMKELQQSRQAVDTALQGIDEERSTLRKEQAETKRSTEEALRAANEEQQKLRKQLEKPATPSTGNATAPGPAVSADENINLKKMAAVFDNMPAENVAKVFLQLVKNKRMDSVVWLMNAMKERQTADVMDAIAETNAELAAELTDRLKRLKTSAVPPAAE